MPLKATGTGSIKRRRKFHDKPPWNFLPSVRKVLSQFIQPASVHENNLLLGQKT
jgi:hypothetical protein